MKKIVVFIGIMSLTTMNYGQVILNNIISPEADYQYYEIGTQPYGFIVDGEKYILSYDTLVNKNKYNATGGFNAEFMKEVAYRPIFIFHYDGKNWVKATTSPIQFDNYTYDSIGYSFFNDGTIKVEYEYNLKYYWCGEGVYKTGDPNGGRVRLLKEGRIAILITYMNTKNLALGEGKNFRVDRKNYFTVEMIVLIPNGDKLYIPKVYQALNVGSKPYDYKSLLTQMDNYDDKKDTFDLVTNGEVIKFKRMENPVRDDFQKPTVQESQ